MNNRKSIKITVPSCKVLEFDLAKERAEQAAMVKMTDTQYASRLIQWALDQQSEYRAAVTVTQEPETDRVLFDVSGRPGTIAYRSADDIFKLWLNSKIE